MARDIVAVAVGRGANHRHVFGGDVDRHVIEGGLHHPASPAAFIGLTHLGVPVGVRRRRKEEGRPNLAAEELRLEGHRAKIQAPQHRVALGAVLDSGWLLVADERIGFQRGVLPGGDRFHHGRGAQDHIARIENALGLLERHLGPAANR